MISHLLSAIIYYTRFSVVADKTSNLAFVLRSRQIVRQILYRTFVECVTITIVIHSEPYGSLCIIAVRASQCSVVSPFLQRRVVFEEVLRHYCEATSRSNRGVHGSCSIFV